MSEYVGPVDALADELLAAIREHPVGLLTAGMFKADGGRVQAAYNRLYCELHDKPVPLSKGAGWTI